MDIIEATTGLSARVLPHLLNPFGPQRLMILIYHRVLPEPDPMRPSEPDVLEFQWQMALLAKHFSPLGLQEAHARLKSGDLPRNAVCVTFDDGYADNAELAQPILQEFAIPATVFVSTAFLNGGRMWNDTVIEAVRRIRGDFLDLSRFDLEAVPLGAPDQRLQSARKVLVAIKHMDIARRQEVTDFIASQARNLPGNLMMTNQQVRAMSTAGVEIGAHTHSHPILASLSDDAAAKEIAEGKERLESVIDAPVNTFAYPNGRPGLDFKPVHRDCLPGLGFNVAVTTQKGVATGKTDPYMLPRFTPWDRSPGKFAVRLLLNTRCVV